MELGYYPTDLTVEQLLLQVLHCFSKHLQAFSCPDRGQSSGALRWAGASCKSISLASSLLKKLDIRTLKTASLLLSLPPEKHKVDYLDANRRIWFL